MIEKSKSVSTFFETSALAACSFNPTIPRVIINRDERDLGVNIAKW